MIDALRWRDASGAAREAHARRILAEHFDHFSGAVSRVRTAELPCYATLGLVELTLEVNRATLAVYGLVGPGHCVLLDGTADPVHAANDIESLELAAATADAYLRFFLFAVRAPEGAFQLCEAPVAGAPAGHPLATFPRPLQAKGIDPKGQFTFVGVIAFVDRLFEAVLAVAPSGRVNMVSERELASELDTDLLPPVPALIPLRAGLARLALERPAPSAAPTRPALRVMVELLLEQALAAQGEQPSLLAYFNARTSGPGPIRRFAEFVATANPVVTVECGIPFVESVVGAIVCAHLPEAARPLLIDVKPAGSDDTLLRPPDGAPKHALMLIPMHSYRGIADIERVVHSLAVDEVGAIIGCTSFAALPEGFKRITDLRLRLLKLAPSLFETLFVQAIGAPLPPDWRKDGTQWVAHVHHTDLQRPHRLGLDPADTLAVVRERVRARLSSVENLSGPRLQDLHGLGEARRFAEDLIADIAAALKGQIAWEAVDRGVLLAGPPGTGKTTLARAIARDCGIKFIGASASGWQAAGFLGDHIRAIRADFAQARQYAPSILFIDEIDSIGNRETFSGHNAQYSTEVVNALLEQISGLDPSAPVFVIGATNDPERVDPALRRAGRLDRVIRIPLPNVDALEHIYRHYLEAHGLALAPDVDVHALAGLSFGLTGADVESMVRGAARRARKDARPVAQADLVAEITGKPRDDSLVPRLTAADIEHVSIHEAGHACARALGSSQGADLAFVSIVPRNNGTLGFVANLPREGVLWTREQYLEQIEIVLAGRAAEEIRFGADGVSGGAGGDSRSSDLAVASRMALQLVCRQGLGPDASLLWADAATPNHHAEAERLLRDAYETVTGRLRGSWPKVERLAAELVRHQELTGERVRAVLAG